MQILADVRSTPLSVDEVLGAVGHPSAGGTALFVGTVRDVDEGRGVTDLHYEAHPQALVRLQEVVERVGVEEDVLAVAAVHRTGDLAVGDLAVVVAAAAEHRAEAFTACRRLIDELKQEVPIWKEQTYLAGDSVWV